MSADLKRLGRRSAYRLGRLRQQGIGEVPPPVPLRPYFSRPYHGPLSMWLLGCAAGTGAILAGAAAGIWFLPFLVGLAAGLVSRLGEWRLRALLIAVVVMALLGWGIPLWWPALHGEPSGGTARVIAALLGLPAHAVVGFAVTLLIAVAQAVVGAWLGRTLAPGGDRRR